MANDGKPELTPRQRNLRTLGLFFLVLVGPLLLLRGACVSYREICEGAGGSYGEVGDVRVCNMPTEGTACPPPYRYTQRGGGCSRRGSLPGVWRWLTW